MICISVLDSPFQSRCAKSLGVDFDFEYDFSSSSLLFSCLKVFAITSTVRAKGLDVLVLGDLRSWCQILAAYLWSPKKLVVVDDGMFSLALFDAFESGVFTNSKAKNFILKIIIKAFNRKNMLTFHTVFAESDSAVKAKRNGYDIRLLTFDTDNKLDTDVDLSKVLFIGQDLVELGIISHKKYLMALKAVAQETEALQAQLIYYPHRAEKAENLKLLESQVPNFCVAKREMPIEDYMLLMTKRPIKVYTFYSTAIFVISRLFPNVDCRAIYVKDAFKTHLKTITIAYNMLSNDKGIIVETFNLND